MSRAFLTIFVSAICALAFSQPSRVYSVFQNVGGNSDETGRQMIQDSAGNLFTLSSSGSGLVVAKRGSTGAVVWKSFFAAEPSGLALTPDGGCAVVGRIDRGNSPVVREIITLKYDISGALSWYRTQTGVTTLPDPALRATSTSDGSIYIGATVNQDTFSDVSLLKYSSAGDLLWQRTQGPNPDQEICLGVQPDSAGNLLLFANRNPSGAPQVVVYKYTPDGGLLWSFATAVVGTAGNIAVDSNGACYIPVNGPTPSVIKVSSGGTQAWKTSLGAINAPFAIALLGTTPYVAGTQITTPNSFVQKLGANGGVVWTVTHPSPTGDPETLNSLAIATDGSAYAAGNRAQTGSAGIFTLKVGSNGTVAWAADHGAYAYTPPIIPPVPPVPPPPLIATTVVMNGAGQPVMYATINGPTASTGYDAEICIDSTTGAPSALNVDDLNGTHDFADASVTDSTGTTFILGNTQQGGGPDAILQQVLPDGTLGWFRGFGGSGPDLDYALASETDGGVVVSYGVFNSSTSMWDTKIRRYDASGTGLWTVSLDGSVHVSSMTCGSDSSIYLVGQDQAVLPNRIHVARLASNGSLLWSTVFPGVGPSDDYPFKIALDSLGNLFVCGNLWDGNRYLATLQRYNPATGAVVWTAPYASSGAGASGFTFVPDNHGGAYLLGTDWAAGGRGLIRRFDNSGSLIFSRIATDADTISERYVAAQLDSAGNLIVAGSAVRSDKNVDLLAEKFNSNGVAVWKQLYNGPANLNDNGRLLAQDVLGSIYVAGTVSGGTSGRDSVIWKLNADGSAAWPDSGDDYTHSAVIYDSGLNMSDNVAGLNSDVHGFVYLSNSMIGTNSTYDINAMKFGTALDSLFVSQSVPSTMVAGQSYYITITYKNTSDFVWSAAAGVELGSINPVDNTTWGTNRIALGSSESIAPGGTKKFSSFRVFAPTIAGTYNFQWSMRTSTGPFGQPTVNVPVAVSLAPNAARYVGQTSPSSVKAGSTFSASIKMRNVGTNTWTVAGAYGLAPSGSPTSWGVTLISVGSNVAPGSDKSFVFNCKAPTTPGTYTFRFQMKNSSSFFGDLTATKSITVTP